jgi:hypothetical protein
MGSWADKKMSKFGHKYLNNLKPRNENPFPLHEPQNTNPKMKTEKLKLGETIFKNVKVSRHSQ